MSHDSDRSVRRVASGLLGLAVACAVAAASDAVVATVSDSQFTIGNRFIERTVSTRDGLQTLRLVNRLTKRGFNVTGEEFLVSLDDGVRIVTGRDCLLAGPPEVADMPRGGKKVTCPLRTADGRLRLAVVYEIGLPDDFYLRKQIVVADAGQRVDVVEVERINLGTSRIARFDQGVMPFPMKPWDIAVGRPLFIDDEVFAGLEYPAGRNECDGQGNIRLRHHPGRRGEVVSRPAVLGVAPNRPGERLNDWFQKYISRIRARPVKRSTQWVAYFQSSMPDEECVEKIAVAERVFARRGVKLDCVLMDSGWTDPQSIMRINPQRPDRLALMQRLARERLGTRLGLHVITSGVKPMVDKDWLAQQGYDLIYHRSRREGAYCFGDPRVLEEFRRNLVQIAKQHAIAAYKFDWGYFACDRPDHRGHRPGLDYGIEANTDNFIRALEAFREASPDIFLFNTGWYSPWWLKWYDAVFSAGADYNFGLRSCPVFTTCAALGTWRDAVVRGNLVQWSPYFPLSSLMQVDPISYWWHDWEVRYREPLKEFSDYVLLSYLRGQQMMEIYFNIAALDDEAADVLAEIMKWASAHDDALLSDCRYFGGDPLLGEVYGYAHFAHDGRGIVGVRNPHVLPQKFALRLDESLGLAPSAASYGVECVYPYRQVLSGRAKYGDALTLEMDGHQLLVLEVNASGAQHTPKRETQRRAEG
ncbi:MAG: hypothetical protein FJ388_12885, partial [Verrucomicrobia bacterium]|nr:hypothetical protein [Verrucomicrobiota bacterium]